MTDLPMHWKKLNKKPFRMHGPVENFVYMIAFFPLKRALLLRKDYTVLCTMETRKAKQLLEEAKEMGWVTVELKDCGLGDRPDHYPKKSEVSYWVEIKDEGNTSSN